jgi:hypothetical protein
MDTKLVILLVLGSLLTMVIFSSSSNFISAVAPEVTKYNCLDSQKLCAVWFADGSSMLCEYNDSSKKWDCKFITSPPKTGSNIPTELKDAIDNAINEVGPSNSNDPKDLGGMKSDKGITKNPIE